MDFRQNSLGDIDVTGDATNIRFFRRFNHSIEDVWRALTSRQGLLAWWGDATIDLDAGVYFVRMLNSDGDGDYAEMHAVVTELRKPNVLQIDGDLHGQVRFELEAEGSQTLMTFTNVVGIPDEQQSLEMASWHFHLDALARALDGQSNDLVDIAPIFFPIHERYLQRAIRATRG